MSRFIPGPILGISGQTSFSPQIKLSLATLVATVKMPQRVVIVTGAAVSNDRLKEYQYTVNIAQVGHRPRSCNPPGRERLAGRSGRHQ
jgi:hypothetical protein